MLVHVVGNAPSSQLETRTEDTSETPVLRDKVFGLPVDRDILFTDENNIYQPGVEKRQRKWIVKLAFLKPFLLSGERVLRIVPARSPIRRTEQIMTGGLFLGLERALLVFTGYRLLHIPTGSDYAYRQSIAQVRYRDIRNIDLRWQTLVIEYKNGRRERFGSIPRRDRKKVRQLLAALPLMKQVMQPVGRRHLCPRCTAVLSEKTMRCRRCELKFKSRKMAGAMALLFPGGGYFYVRQFFPAAVFFTLEALVAAMLAAVVLAPVPLKVNPSLVSAGLVLVWAGLKIIGWRHAEHFLKRYIPRKRRLGRWAPSVTGDPATA
jgi:ribosomal protein L40E